ncbi:hypothetical protein MTR67_030514 [Solanum verrucosum]|uniref:Uncharacterized protein n=1 Tax=Solanum verrucosum TaxID=315347 RepID=A0AAF0RE47_SOLVR|nr:hypothetical protein MTR67_030514 [Solanum verrucosum]
MQWKWECIIMDFVMALLRTSRVKLDNRLTFVEEPVAILTKDVTLVALDRVLDFELEWIPGDYEDGCVVRFRSIWRRA